MSKPKPPGPPKLCLNFSFFHLLWLLTLTGIERGYMNPKTSPPFRQIIIADNLLQKKLFLVSVIKVETFSLGLDLVLKK
jgi:hypothetical protein